MRSFRILSLLLLAAMLPACATITSGSSQGISVITEPAGASCAVQREGATIGVVNPTPGTVQVSKSMRDISVRCTRQGYSASVVAIPAQFQAMTAGNLLLGGVIGLAVDAASGAMGRYQETVTVSLPAEDYTSEMLRDEAFREQAVNVRRNFQDRAALILGQCPTETLASCEARARELDAERDAELSRLEQLRNSARIGA